MEWAIDWANDLKKVQGNYSSILTWQGTPPPGLNRSGVFGVFFFVFFRLISFNLLDFEYHEDEIRYCSAQAPRGMRRRAGNNSTKKQFSLANSF